MGREYHRCAVVAQTHDLALEQIGVYGVEAREGLVEDAQPRLVHHRGDELHLLGHTLREILDLLVPPILDAEAYEPLFESLDGLAARETLEACEEDGLLSHLHLLVETALLGQVAYVVYVVIGDGVSVEDYGAGIGQRDAVDDAYERRLAGAVGAEQTVYGALRHLERNVIESRMARVAFGDVLDLQNIHVVSCVMCYNIIVCSYSQSHRIGQNYKTENKKSYFLRLKYHYVVRIWVIRTLTRRPYKELPYRPYRPEVRKESKNLASSGECLIFVAVSVSLRPASPVWESKGKRVRIPYSSRCCMLLRLRADVGNGSLDH